MKILTFLKSNLKYVLIIGGVLFLILWFSFKQGQIKRLTAKITTLEMSNFALDNDRQTLEALQKKLQNENNIIWFSNDSLKKAIAKYQIDFINLKKAHEKELAELAKIPHDTVFVRLQALYYNYDNLPLKYPFSGSQIAGMYKTSIELGNLTEEYSAQGKTLNTCLKLNDGFESSIFNLNKQVSIFKTDIAKCDLQGVNYNKNIDLLNKQINRKTFWARTLGGGLIVTTLLLIIK